MLDTLDDVWQLARKITEHADKTYNIIMYCNVRYDSRLLANELSIRWWHHGELLQYSVVLSIRALALAIPYNNVIATELNALKDKLHKDVMKREAEYGQTT